MRAALQEIRSTITFHFAVVWLAPPYHTTCTGVSATSISNTRGASATDRSSTLITHKVRPALFSLWHQTLSPPAAWLAPRHAPTRYPNHAEFATALALSLVLAFVVSVCPKTARATTGRGPNLILVALTSLGL